MLPQINTVAKIQSKNTNVTQSGKNITSLRLSVGEKNQKGEYDNFYFDCTFWEKTATVVDSNFNEGDFIMVKGDLITTSYDKNGTKVYKTEVKFPKFGFVPRNNGERTQAPSNDYSQPAPSAPAPQPSIPEIDLGDVPF